jgi:hypothetical protein
LGRKGKRLSTRNSNNDNKNKGLTISSWVLYLLPASRKGYAGIVLEPEGWLVGSPGIHLSSLNQGRIVIP